VQSMTSLERIKATYEFRPVDHLIRREFYIWTEALDRWKAEGMPSGVSQSELFGYDPHAGGSAEVAQRLLTQAEDALAAEPAN